mmetsp:Transcript_42965/g.98676  ORF Transcript_42965/g.98676 Transcript_42965/m.98676 type:complete len:702 (-) Transcript_42965:26-2131(-)
MDAGTLQTRLLQNVGKDSDSAESVHTGDEVLLNVACRLGAGASASTLQALQRYHGQHGIVMGKDVHGVRVQLQDGLIWTVAQEACRVTAASGLPSPVRPPINGQKKAKRLSLASLMCKNMRLPPLPWPRHGPVAGNAGAALMAATMGFFAGCASVPFLGAAAAQKEFQVLLNHASCDIVQSEWAPQGCEESCLSPQPLSFLIAAPSLTGSLLRIPVAACVDSIGGKKPFTVLLLVAIIGMLGMVALLYALENSKQHLLCGNGCCVYWLLIFLGEMVGCGIAVFPVGAAQISYWFPRRQHGQVLGFYAGCGNMSPGIIMLVFPFLVESLGLVWTYSVWLVGLIIATTFYYLLSTDAAYFQLLDNGAAPEVAKTVASQEHMQEVLPHIGQMRSLWLSALSWKTWALASVYFVTFGGFVGLTSWLPTFWSNLHSVKATTAGGYTAWFSLGTSFWRVPGGWLSDWMGGCKTLLTALVALELGAIALTCCGESFTIALIGESLLAAGMGMGNAAVFKLVPQEVSHAVGGASGWVSGIGAFGGFAIPPVLGWFASKFDDKRGYSIGFITFMALALLALLPTLALHLHTTLMEPSRTVHPNRPPAAMGVLGQRRRSGMHRPRTIPEEVNHESSPSVSAGTPSPPQQNVAWTSPEGTQSSPAGAVGLFASTTSVATPPRRPWASLQLPGPTSGIDTDNPLSVTPGMGYF